MVLPAVDSISEFKGDALMISTSFRIQPEPTAQARKLWIETGWHILPPLVYLLAMLRFFPYWNMFWLYFDEGYDLMKALLVLRGHALYSQIWNDQPPLFTYLNTILFRINGPGVYASRLLVLFFSCILIWAVVQYMRLAWGQRAAIIVIILLILLPYFPLLSVAALVGQPALALATVSLFAVLLWHQRKNKAYLILSAFALSLSILSKLYTLVLAPVLVAGLLSAEFVRPDGQENWLKRLQPALIWLVIFSGVSLFSGLILVGPENFIQLIRPHLAASQTAVYQVDEQHHSIIFWLRGSWTIFLLSAFAIVDMIRQHRWFMLYPLAWMITAILVLLFTRIVWSHHQLLVTIPVAMLAAGGAAEMLHRISSLFLTRRIRFSRFMVALMGLVAISLVLFQRLPDIFSLFSTSNSITDQEKAPLEEKILRKIHQYSSQTNWMVTDMPMYAFRANILVPPNLAVTSWKRFASGELTETEIIATVQEYKPEQVLIGRFDFPLLDQFLQQDYQLIFERDGTTMLYVRKDLLK